MHVDDQVRPSAHAAERPENGMGARPLAGGSLQETRHGGQGTDGQYTEI